MSRLLALSLIALAAAAVAPARPRAAPPAKVLPTAETDPVADEGDAADDPAIWVNPIDPARSRILGTNKKGGLCVYDLDGQLRQTLSVGKVNNVDLRTGFMLGGHATTLVGAGRRDDGSIHFWTIDDKTATVRDLPGELRVTVKEPYGFCMARDKAGRTYALVNDKSGLVQQWSLDGSGGTITGTLARELRLPSQVEGMAADDELGWLYIGEEKAGVHRVALDPASKAPPVLAAPAGAGGHITPDTEGVAIFDAGDGTGYLIVSSQGDSTFAVYDRVPPNAYVGSFQIGDSPSVDGCSHTDGIDVTGLSLGAAYPRGLLVAQDGENGGASQNFKLVPWENVTKAFRPPLRARAGGAEKGPAR